MKDLVYIDHFANTFMQLSVSATLLGSICVQALDILFCWTEFGPDHRPVS